MADIYIGYNFGADLSPDQATEGASTGSTDVELRISTTNLATAKATRLDVLLIMEAIERYLSDGRTNVLTE